MDQRPCTCGRTDPAPGTPYTLEQCRLCWLWHHDEVANLAWGGPGLPYTRSLPCRHRGGETGLVRCTSCQGKVQLKTFACSLHVDCTLTRPLSGYAVCQTCPDYRPRLPEPVFRQQFQGMLPGHNLNPSICAYQGRLYLAHRRHWSGAGLVLQEIDGEGRVLSTPRHLSLGEHGEDAGAQEDPRLFIYREQLHVSYTGVQWQEDGIVTHMMVARITPEGRVEESWCPRYTDRRHWEKNWSFFDHQGQLHCIYQPHRVLHLDDQHQAVQVAEHSLPFWPYGERRGGASPVLHRGEWYVFDHSRLPQDNGYYTVGIYTFEAQSPFRITRTARHPLILPEGKKPAAHLPSVVYPGGAVFRGGCWWLAYGRFDTECWLAAWLEESVEEWLKPLT